MPLAVCDVGTSAGTEPRLRSLPARLRRRWHDRSADSDVRITCAVTGGTPPIAPALPPIAAQIGLDRSPVEPDPTPTTRNGSSRAPGPTPAGSTARAAAIRLAQGDPPTIRRGDMVADVYQVLAELPREATICVLTTWAVSYLSRSSREDFAAELARMGRDRTVVWISGEGPNVVRRLSPISKRRPSTSKPTSSVRSSTTATPPARLRWRSCTRTARGSTGSLRRDQHDRGLTATPGSPEQRGRGLALRGSRPRSERRTKEQRARALQARVPTPRAARRWRR